ncbi:MAG: hypothetical protein ACM3NQ_24775 [Bacteroidales bacterium]
MNRLAIVIGAIVLLGVSATAALAQRRAVPITATAVSQRMCTMESLAGDYVFQSKGSSTIAMGPAQNVPNHLMAAYAPVAVVGRMTIGVDGAVDGIYWGTMGTSSSDVDPTAWHGDITDFADCRGIITYTIPILGSGGAVGQVTERFFVVDGGQELRTAMIGFINVATSASLPPVWNTVARRVNTARVNQQALRGAWVLTCDSLHAFATPPMPGVTHLAESAVISLDVAANGQFTGLFETKIGPSPLQFPVTGTVAVAEGATLTGEMQTPAMPGKTIIVRGVLFGEGKEFLAIPIGTWDGTTLTPNGYDNCRGIRAGR